MQYTLHCIVNNKKRTSSSKQYTSFTDFKNMGVASEERRRLHPKTNVVGYVKYQTFLKPNIYLLCMRIIKQVKWRHTEEQVPSMGL